MYVQTYFGKRSQKLRYFVDLIFCLRILEYYAIRNNQLNNRIYLLNANSSGKRNQIVPEVKKGYYSIGRNAEKLQK